MGKGSVIHGKSMLSIKEGPDSVPGISTDKEEQKRPAEPLIVTVDCIVLHGDPGSG